jgi:archaemetzincin
MDIKLQPVGEIDGQLLNGLQKGLQNILGCPVALKHSMKLPSGAYHADRDQYLADDVLDKLRAARKTGTYVLGVTGANIFTHGKNFVFGEANPSDEVAIISLFLLTPHDADGPSQDDLLLQRAIKESVHEIGHLLGMEHCPNGSCVMHFSGSLIDTDVKMPHFCTNCQPRLIV